MVTEATHIIQDQLTQGAQLVETTTQLWTTIQHHSTLKHIQKELQQVEATLDQVRASTTSALHLAVLYKVENLRHDKHVIRK